MLSYFTNTAGIEHNTNECLMCELTSKYPHNPEYMDEFMLSI